MTMEHIARSFAVSLHVRHPNIDPEVVTNVLGLIPDRSTLAGTLRQRAADGVPTGGTYERSWWYHRFDLLGARDLHPVLAEVVGRLEEHWLFFHRIVNEEGTVELFCGVDADGNWDEALPHALLGRLANLRIDLRLDVYPKKFD